MKSAESNLHGENSSKTISWTPNGSRCQRWCRGQRHAGFVWCWPLAILPWMLLGEVPATWGQEKVTPLPRAHAHNDYYHPRPLLDALDQGFCSVEADVFLRQDELVVAHSFLEIQPERTLEKLYLEPLFQRVRDNEGSVLDRELDFILLVDFKSDGVETLPVLHRLLEPYRPHLTRLENGKRLPGAVTVVVSGNRPTRQIVDAKDRLVFLDGRWGDPTDWTADISPLVSESWNSHFRYRGFGNMPDDEREKLKAMVEKIHQQQKRIRFWALPDRPAAWQVAFESGVDLINTDRLKALREFLIEAD